MQITIDTKEESKEEIKKLISFLQKLIDEDSYSSYNSTDSPEPAAGAFNMFSDNSPSESSDSSGYTNIFGENKPEENNERTLHNPKEDGEPFKVRDILEQY
ncbi:MAG: hypothetical protein KAQ83_00380 [Nanoarchaeota archaeon]|nr:hypothetical protein [Nanoarchaeota archaeon]